MIRFSPTFKALLITTLVYSISSCQKIPSKKVQVEDSKPLNKSTLTFLFNPDQGLETVPNLYEISLIHSEEDSVIAKRRGELGDSGSLIKISNLPAAANVKLKATLYLDSFSPDTVTHSCNSLENIDLIRDQMTSVALSCYAITTSGKSGPVKLIYKVANVDATLSIVDSEEILRSTDWDEPSLFVGFHKRGIRVSIKSWGNRIKLYVGGKFQFISEENLNLLGVLKSKQSITLYRDGGNLIESAPETVTLNIMKPLLYETNSELKVALPIEVKGTDQFEVSGILFEQDWNQEFTVASYNVENLFDEEDTERNSFYGDFRILPNERGQHSNWGDLVDYEGEMINFTEAKVKGIVKVLTGIEPTGPAYVNLQEIESKRALEVLFTAMQEFGYVDYAFTEWAPGDETAIGLGVISKFPIIETTLLKVNRPATQPQEGTKMRPVFKVTIEPIPGKKLVIYNNHWKSKGGPESFRLEFARTVATDIKNLLSEDENADYIITGDLNCDYNENVILNDRHNDTNGQTGINDILNSQGNEVGVANGSLEANYNLHYELPMGERKTAWYSRYGWSSFDNFIIGEPLYDQINYTYVDNSFSVAHPKSKSLSFLFDSDGHPIRWKRTRTTDKYSKHELGGYSDHLPIHARFYYSQIQSERTIRLINPGRPDLRDDQLEE